MDIIKLHSKDILFGFIVLIIFICSIYVHDDVFSLLSGIFGIIYTILIGRRLPVAYFFGAIGTLCGAFLSYKLSLWGNFSLHLFYYFPMMIIGFLNWRAHVDDKKREVIKEKLKRKELIFYCALCFSVICLVYLIFVKIGDRSPFLDSTVTVLSLFGMFLTVGRYIEQWIVWIVVDFLLIFMWFFVVQDGGHTIAVLISRFIYLILGIYFYNNWLMSKE